MNLNNIDFSNPANVPLILLINLACQNKESMKEFEKYLEEYKEKIKENNNVQSIQKET